MMTDSEIAAVLKKVDNIVHSEVHGLMNTSIECEDGDVSTKPESSLSSASKKADKDGESKWPAASDRVLIPNWDVMDGLQMYDELNPLYGKGTAWAKFAIKLNGAGAVQPRAILKTIIKAIKNYSKDDSIIYGHKAFQTVKERDIQRDSFSKLNENVLMLMRNHLKSTVTQAIDSTGKFMTNEQANINVLARIILLGNDPLTLKLLNEIHALPEKDERQVRLEDESLTINALWNQLAKKYLNAETWEPENIWSEQDDRIKQIDLHMTPDPTLQEYWTGENLRDTWTHFQRLFGIIDEYYYTSGKNDAESFLDQANHFWNFIGVKFQEEVANVHIILLFAFWVYNGTKWPSCMSEAKPFHQQLELGNEVVHIEDSDKADTIRVTGGKRKSASEGLSIFADVISKDHHQELLMKQSLENARLEAVVIQSKIARQNLDNAKEHYQALKTVFDDDDIVDTETETQLKNKKRELKKFLLTHSFHT